MTTLLLTLAISRLAAANADVLLRGQGERWAHQSDHAIRNALNVTAQKPSMSHFSHAGYSPGPSSVSKSPPTIPAVYGGA